VDASRRSELHRWAAGLERSDVAERRAAGRAVAGLCAGRFRDPERLAELRVWASALEGSDDAELRAAAAAIAALASQEAEAPPDPVVPARRAPPRRPKLPWRRVAVALGVCVALAGAAALAADAARGDMRAGGPTGTIGAPALADVAFWTAAGDADQTWTLDGRRVAPRREGARLVLRPKDLGEGEHVLEIRTDGGLFRSASRSFRFTVDTTPPVLRLAGPAVARPGKPVAIAGRLEPGASLLVGRRDVRVDDEGRFSFRADRIPEEPLVFAATDAAGNRSRWRVPVTIAPRRPEQPIRAVHVTAAAWANDELREGVMDLVRAGRVNAVELDLKDEAGELGWDAPVPLAHRIGAVRELYDLKAAVDELHTEGVRVIGRLVCFRDPIHAKAAWDAGRRAEVVQSADGGPYSGYGGFTNFASPVVRRYQIDVALAAAKLGVDEILYDYVRRPDGPLSTMAFPGLKGTPERAIVDFLRETRVALAGTDVLVGASVFGVAATRPTEVAQDIPAMARQVDYIAPMVYPSHWGPGEYGVADPNGSPYEITKESVADFVRLARGTGARIVPWLQDFSLGREYGPAEVAAQIEASRDAGADEFILWDAAVTYTAEGLATDARRPALRVTTAAPRDAPGPTRLPDA
jgi:hypothetical protein